MMLKITQSLRDSECTHIEAFTRRAGLGYRLMALGY